MSQVTCYKAGMSRQGEGSAKKVRMLGLKVDEPTGFELDGICNVEDRPLGYVARALLLRGLAAYRRDGRLREPAPVESHPGPTIKVPMYEIGEKEKKKRRA